MEHSIINFGRYKGYTFQQLLEYDLNYCKFIHKCIVNPQTKDFKDWLSLNNNLENQLKKKQQEKNDLAMKKLNKI